jgi:iron complex outermembrane receptor protein
VCVFDEGADSAARGVNMRPIPSGLGMLFCMVSTCAMAQAITPSAQAKSMAEAVPPDRQSLKDGSAGGAVARRAQQSAANSRGQSAQPEAPRPTGTVEEVIVTAQRREESLQKVPIAMTALSGDFIKQRNLYDSSQLQYVVPSLQLEGINDQVGAIDFFIRGVGSALGTPAGESSVATVLDGVVMGRPEMGVVQFFDVQRVEVLRGPQGFLFGKNASAGLINIVTTLPQLGRYETEAHFEYGGRTAAPSGNELVSQVAVNIPLGSSQALRLDVFANHDDPLFKDILPGNKAHLGQTEGGARLKYLWRPTERLEIYAIADYAREAGAGTEQYSSRFDAPGGFFQTLDQAAGIHPSPTNVYIAANAPIDNHFAVGGGQLQLTYHLDGGFDLTNLIAGRAFIQTELSDGDNTPASVLDRNTRGLDERQFSDELRLTSPSQGAFTYQLGLYYFDARYTQNNDQSGRLEGLVPPPPPGTGFVGILYNETILSKSYAAFGQGVYHFTDRLRLIAGGRVTHDVLSGTSVANLGDNLFPLFDRTPIDQQVTVTNFSGRVGGEFDIAPDNMAYFTYSRGYKGPAINDATDATTPLRPEIPTDFELGLKSTLFDHRLVLNVALFDEDYKNYQAQGFDPGKQIFVLLNAGELASRGVEIDFTARPAPGLTISGGASYDDAHYVSFKGQTCYPLEPLGTGRNQCAPNGTSDASGNRLENAPRWTVSATATYEHPLTQALDGFVEGDYYYRSSVFYIATNDPRELGPAYGIIGGSVGVSSHNGTWRLSAFVRNLLDKRFSTYILENPLSSAVGDDALGGVYLNFFGINSFRTIGVALDLKL